MQNVYGFCANNSLAFADNTGLNFGVWCGAGPTYNNWNPVPASPEGPDLSDALNPFGLRPSTPENYTQWFDQRFPKTVAFAKKLLDERIKTYIHERCKLRPRSIPGADGEFPISDVDILPSGYHKLMPVTERDPKESFYERWVKIGSYQFKTDPITVQWPWSLEKCGCSIFHYKTKMYVLEHTGADPDQNLFFFGLSLTRMFVPRDVRMAEWNLEGYGMCCDSDSLPEARDESLANIPEFRAR